MTPTSSALAPVLALGLALLAGDVHTVPGDFGTVQAAVDAAADGDVVLVSPGVDREVVTITGKGLSLVGDGGRPTFDQLRVDGVPAGSTVLLRGLEADPFIECVFILGCTEGPGPALVVTDCTGLVRVEDCRLDGMWGVTGGPSSGYSQRGDSGLVAEGSAAVVVADSEVLGGWGANLEDELTDQAGRGGDALQATASSVWISYSTVRGGVAGAVFDSQPVSADGGHAIVNDQGEVTITGGQVVGGPGGNGECEFGSTFCGSGGDGGDGVRQTGDGSRLILRNVRPKPGAAGPGPFGGSDGSAGLGLRVLGGSVFDLRTPSADLAVSSPVRAGGSAALTLAGEPGTSAVLFASFQAGAALFVPGAFALHLGAPLLPGSLPLGVTDGAGELAAAIPMPPLPPGEEGLDIHLQALLEHPVEGLALSDATTLTWVAP